VRVLVTRPREDARALAGTLAARGIESVVAPLLDIVPRAAELDLASVQALLLTSANGARALGHATARRDLPVLAVGEATAAAARAEGFAEVAVGGGDVAALAELARVRLDPDRGPLLHVAGSAVAGDLAGHLGAAGFSVRRVVLYEARAATRLPEIAAAALDAGTLDAVLLFSPRTARHFVTLVAEAGRGPALRRLRALCLSQAVAEAAGAAEWRALSVARRPDQGALLALLEPATRPSESGD